jgi:hypothetical protein
MAADGTLAALVHARAPRSFGRVEAFVGLDPAAAGTARALLAKLPGVTEVVDQGRLGIHHAFDVVAALDLREDVGALCAQKGWALRELSWRRPTLEELFARIALGLDPAQAAAGAPVAPPPGVPARGAAAAPFAPLAGGLTVLETPRPASSPSGPSAPPAASAPAAPTTPPATKERVIYSLNPFDRGATRDLSKPQASDAPGSAGEEP